MSNVPPEWYQLRDALYYVDDFSAAEALLQKHPELLDLRNGIGETVLHFLAVEDYLPGIEWLHARGASLNSTNKWGTPLLFEVAHLNHRHLYLWLVGHGARADQKDANGRSIHDYLTEFDRPDMIAFINQHAAHKA